MAVFLEAKNAHSVLKRFPRANEFLEELRQGTIERECMEEICSYEEVKEVFEDKEKTMEFWKGYPNAVYSVRDPAQSSDAMYVVVPLLGVALLIVIALFIIWRCQLQKATRHHPSYAQNRLWAVSLSGARIFLTKISLTAQHTPSGSVPQQLSHCTELCDRCPVPALRPPPAQVLTQIFKIGTNPTAAYASQSVSPYGCRFPRPEHTCSFTLWS
ncbi:transmembrane gamma-carboxyglutamic acid protein 3 isoform X2 [Delphinapterus leucas]|uniref:Transmembrane gamma-carboxyglutamic acid protein 3 isoform X2 n=1 Tax=Delphinapterus leucas TaxID=9749 RepID=A0A2Y9MCP7_DELLE|nr:transmembrane gamma-carboxyglutamic acid protein 3 isoform X2 [Delphinapterus leucas]